MKNWKMPENATETDRRSLQRLAREEIKMKLLVDLRIDMEVCMLEGWDKTEFLNELKELINSFKGD